VFVHTRLLSSSPSSGLTLPLLTTVTGEKLGKSVGNAVWLSGEKTSSYELYQHFVRTADQEVEMYLKYFTLLSMEEIQQTMREHKVRPLQSRLSSVCIISRLNFSFIPCCEAHFRNSDFPFCISRTVLRSF